MPYSTPSGPANAAYTVYARSVQLVEGGPVTFQVTVSAEALDHPDVGAIVQSFVDTVHASPAFTVTSAGRTTGYSESLTPSVAG
jgi:hypothetical protein